jgi:hypothetical protein
MDYPDSDEEAGCQASGVNPSILNMEDTEMAEDATEKQGTSSCGSGSSETILEKRWRASSAPIKTHHLAQGRKIRSTGHGDGRTLGDGPDLPPIYLTVCKEREKKLVTRHLNGGGVAGAVSTSNGASVSQIETVGSFANAGDRRHNHTQFKHNY